MKAFASVSSVCVIYHCCTDILPDEIGPTSSLFMSGIIQQKARVVSWFLLRCASPISVASSKTDMARFELPVLTKN